MTLEKTQSVPLTLWEDGSIRVKDTRLLLDLIVNAHKRGECPEEIYEAFPSDSYSVADVYAIVAYYLTNKNKIERYLAKREKQSEQVWTVIEADPRYQTRKKTLKQKVAAYKKGRS